MASDSITPMPQAVAADSALAALCQDLSRRRFAAAFRKAASYARKNGDQRHLDLLSSALKFPRTLASQDKRLQGTQPYAVLTRCFLLEGEGRYAEAVQALESLGKLKGPHAWILYHRGSYRLHGKHPESAREDFSAALKAAPGLWRARAFLGELEMVLGQQAKALKIFDGLCKTLSGPEAAEALAWRGMVRLYGGQAAQAHKDLDRALSYHALFAQGWRGAARVLLGKRQGALEDLDAALAARAHDRESRLWRGELLRTSGRFAESEKELLAVAKSGGQFNVWACANLILLYTQRRGVKDALLLRRLYRGIPKEYRELFTVGDKPSPTLCKRLLKAGKGIRRSDRYLEPLWRRA